MKSPQKLFAADDYLNELIYRVKHAKSRIYMVALVITDDDATSVLMDELVEAAKRGVEVNLASDLYFTYRELGTHGSRMGYIRSQIRNMYALKRSIEKHGGTVTWLGQNGLTLFSRRTHSKWSIVDDVVFAFGGVNLYSNGLRNNDFMLMSHDSELADWLITEQTTVIRYDKAGRSQRSHQYGDDKNMVLIDGGLMGDSIIYRRASYLTDRATSITYVSQYSPTGRLGAKLKKAKTKFYFNRWQNANSLNRAWLRFSSRFKHIPNSYRKKRYLHAKFIIFELPNKEKIAITGSHNYLAGGGLLGTREIALETRDPKVIKLLESFLEQHVA